MKIKNWYFALICIPIFYFFILPFVFAQTEDSTRLEMVITEDEIGEKTDSTFNDGISEAIVIQDSTISPLDSTKKLIRPSKSLAQLEAEYSPLGVSRTAAESMEPDELEARFLALGEIRKHLRLNIRWRAAYGATDEDLKGENALMNKIRISMAFSELQAKEERRRRADEAIKDLLNTDPEQMYDAETLKLNNPEIINTLKENIFYSTKFADFNSVALGTVLRNCQDFGFHPHTRATGYRLGIGDHTDKYNLFILRLHTGEVKAFLWDDIYAKIVDVM